MSFAGLVRGEMAVAMAAGLVLGLLLLALRPAERAATRNLLIVLGACAIAALAGTVAISLGASSRMAIAADIASVVTGLVVIRLTALFAFRVVLPKLGVKPARIAEDLVTAVLFALWALVWLRLSGVDPASLFATSAVVTAVLAFSMQDTLGNVLGGVLLQLDRSIRVGDWVRVDDTSGRVAEVRWRHTAIETRNGETLIIPNGWLLKNRFVLLGSRSDPLAPWRRWVRLNTDLATPPGTVCAVLEEAVTNAAIANVAKHPAPSAILMDLGPRQASYALRYWIHDRAADDATDSVVRAHVLAALTRHDIKLAVPYQEQLSVKDNEAHREAERAAEQARRMAALEGVELFASLDPNERALLAGHLVHAPFVAGDVITRQGAIAHWLYLIVSGRAEVLLESPEGPRRVSTLEAGDVFGEMGMMTGAPRRATVTALTDVVCYRLDKAGFSAVLMARPDIAAAISKVLAARNAELEGTRAAAGGAQPAIAQDRAILERIRNFFGLRETTRATQATLS